MRFVRLSEYINICVYRYIQIDMFIDILTDENVLSGTQQHI